MKPTVALSILLLCSAATIQVAQAGQIKIPTVAPHINIQPKIGSSTARAASSPHVSEIVVTKGFDTSSPKLSQSVATGKPFDDKGSKTTTKPTYLHYDLKEVYISSYSY